MTINEAMALQRAVQTRLRDLKGLRLEVVAKRDKTYIYGEQRQQVEKIEPQYDVKAVDKKITELEMFLYKLDAGIKQANAKTEIEGIDIDVDKLLEPLQ